MADDPNTPVWPPRDIWQPLHGRPARPATPLQRGVDPRLSPAPPPEPPPPPEPSPPEPPPPPEPPQPDAPAADIFPDSSLEARLLYASALGWITFPLKLERKPDGKRVKKSWKSGKFSNGARWGQSRDPDVIRADHRKYPSAGVGVPTGSTNRVMVLEYDTPEGHGVDGEASLRALEGQHEPLPETLTAQSPTGSTHRYLGLPDGVLIKNSANELAPGIDIRGEGGMAAAPPSQRDDGRYCWLNWGTAIAMAPDWLIAKCRIDVTETKPRSYHKRGGGRITLERPPKPIPPDRAAAPEAIADAEAALIAIPLDYADDAIVNKLLRAAYWAGVRFETALAWCRTDTMKRLQPGRAGEDWLATQWASFGGNPRAGGTGPSGGVGPGTLYREVYGRRPGWAKPSKGGDTSQNQTLPILPSPLTMPRPTANRDAEPDDPESEPESEEDFEEESEEESEDQPDQPDPDPDPEPQTFNPDALIDAAVDDNTVVYKPNVLAALAQLYRDDRVAYERLLDDLKAEAKVGKTALNKAVLALVREHIKAEPPPPPPPPPPPKDLPKGALILDPQHPLANARKLVRKHFSHPDGQTLYEYRGAFYRWSGAAFLQIKPKAIRSKLWHLLDESFEANPKTGALMPFKPTSRRVSEVLDALSAAAYLDDEIDAPAWIGPHRPSDAPPPLELLACKNGVLHLPSGRLLPPSPALFNVNAIDIAYDPKAPKPEAWLSFLDQVFADPEIEGGIDTEAILCLQEYAGYTLVPDTSLQKILFMVGPPRSGKGTIAAVFRRFVGKTNVAAPTLSSLTREFGREPLIDKTLAIIGDARMGRRMEQSFILEILLSISGEDFQTVPRKYLEAWHGMLLARFIMMSNELPHFDDAAIALIARLLLLRLRNSFLGKEDMGLLRKLLREMPSILNWAREGYLSLHQRGHFLQPASSLEALNQMVDLSSPVKHFVAVCCQLGPECEVTKAHLFARWKMWCEQINNVNPGDLPTFGKNLLAAFPAVRNKRPREGEERSTAYSGIELL